MLWFKNAGNARRRFIDIDISNPASISYYLVLEILPISRKLKTPGYLVDGVFIFGHNTYVNLPYMATRYKQLSAGPKDAFNFYQSQLRKDIECTFGILENQWYILRYSIVLNIGKCKTASPAHCLCCLNNWLIDENQNIFPSSTCSDRFSSMMQGGDLGWSDLRDSEELIV